MNGVVTTAPQLGRAAFDGTTGTQSLECAADGVPATSFAGICVMDLLDVHVVELEQAQISASTRSLSAGTIGVSVALFIITFFNVLTLRWARQSRQKTLPPEERDPVWTPIIRAAVSRFVYVRWKWINRFDELIFVIVSRLGKKSVRLARRITHAVATYAGMCRKTCEFSRFAFFRMLRRAIRTLRFFIDRQRLRSQLRSTKRLRIDLEPLETLGERAAKARDRRLRTLRSTSEEVKWLPAFAMATARVEALELIMLCQNKLRLSPEQLDTAASNIWTVDVRTSLADLSAARKALRRVLYAARLVDEEAPTTNERIREVLKDMDEEMASQLKRSPTFAGLNVQGVVEFPKRAKLGKPCADAASEGSMSAEEFKLVTILEEYAAIGAISGRLIDMIRINEINELLTQIEELVGKPLEPPLDPPIETDLASKIVFADERRTKELEPFITYATDFLSERRALNLDDGSERPQMLALKQRTVDAMMLATAHQAVEALHDSTGERLDVEGLLTFRSEKLEPRELLAEVYLIEHDAASYLSPVRTLDGQDSQPELLAIKQRIVDVTLLAVERTVDLPIDRLSKVCFTTMPSYISARVDARPLPSSEPPEV